MDKRLEDLSDMVRKGIPVGIGEAFEVIDYQERLRVERADKWNKSFIGRVVNFFKPNATGESRGIPRTLDPIVGQSEVAE